MSRPKALDLFSGAGGASMGLYRAGFDVTGLDHRKQPRYPFRFVQGDALNPPFRLSDFDLVWASPPCQGYSKTRRIMEGKGIANPRANNLIPAVRAMLKEAPAWVIENVPGAPLAAFQLCGAMFGLRVIRHRMFESSLPVMVPAHPRHVGGTGSHRGYSRGHAYVTVGGHNYNPTDGRDAMGIDWMTRDELNEAIPPAYSEHIGRYAMIALGRAVA